MSNVCEQFGAVVGLSASELASLTAFVNANGLSDKLSEHITYARKRPGTIAMIKSQWLAKLPKQVASQAVSQADSTPPIPGEAVPPPIAATETYSHAAINGAAVAGQWTMESAFKAGASSVWRKGLESWLPCEKLSVQPAKRIIPMVDGFAIPWPIEVELAKNGKFYANLTGSMKPLGKGKIGIELTMLRALLGEDSQYRQAILAEVEKLQS